MNKLWTNATVWWDEQEIIARECLVRRCHSIIKQVWVGLNSAVRFYQIETPILTPADYLTGHLKQGFPLIASQSYSHAKLGQKDASCGYLRPETTAGSIAVIDQMYPMANQLAKALPICLWQAGKSFRDEHKPETMRASKLRLREFWQLEFHLFAADSTKCDYITPALSVLRDSFGGHLIVPNELPHYSRKTTDWEMDCLEVAGCSERTDWSDGIIFEISIGLDRLLKMTDKM